VLCLGVALLSASRSVKPIGLSFGSVSHWPAAALIAAIAFICVRAGWKRRSRTRAMLTGIGAGLVFGIQDALTRQTLQIQQSNGISGMLTSWAPYALVGAGAMGIWLMQNAFSAGPLQVSLPAISAGEPLVGMLLGILVFGDRIQITPGELAIQAGGIAALVVGVIMVGRAPALSQLRSWTPSSLPHTIPHSIPHSLHVRHSARDAPDAPDAPDAREEDEPDGAEPPAGPSLNGHSPDGQDRPADKQTSQESQPDLQGLRAPDEALTIVDQYARPSVYEDPLSSVSHA
jgi:hypothetical protein